jgi:hypothetical protein
MEGYCNKFEQLVIATNFVDYKTKELTSKARDSNFCLYPPYRRNWEVFNNIINIIMDMFEIDYFLENKAIHTKNIVLLSTPEIIQDRQNFQINVSSIKFAFNHCKQELDRKLSLLDKEERARLDEALNCYLQGCNYSTVAMAVSAIEYRLYSLMMTECPTSELEKRTLGELIKEYLDNKKKYHEVIPKKHEPLLQYSNTYRVFSVHAKKEKITRPVTTSIINMTFGFLFDENLKAKLEEKKKVI